MSRVIRVIGPIDSEAFEKFSEKLAEMEEFPKKPVLVELCSGGGETYVGLAFYGRIRASPCTIDVTAYGQVMSAATVILIAGKCRTMHRDSWFMIHDDNQRVRAENGLIAVSEAQHLDTLEEHWAEIMARHTHLTPETWRQASKKTTYMDAEQCESVGIIHRII